VGVTVGDKEYDGISVGDEVVGDKEVGISVGDKVVGISVGDKVVGISVGDKVVGDSDG
jgi:hypothetical protein